MNSVKKTAVAVALGSVVMSTAFAVNAQTNPFGFEAMDAGYQIVGSEGKCGEAKCGADMKKAAAEKAKEGKLTMEEMSGGTFTLSSLGGIGGKFFTPIINKPEVAIMGVSRMYKKVVLDKYGLTKELNILPFSLSYASVALTYVCI